jgi:hypothetical protein
LRLSTPLFFAFFSNMQRLFFIAMGASVVLTLPAKPSIQEGTNNKPIHAVRTENNEPFFWMSTVVPNKKFTYDETVSLNRADAQTYCRQLGGQLATIANAEEQHGLDQFMKTGKL